MGWVSANPSRAIYGVRAHTSGATTTPSALARPRTIASRSTESLHLGKSAPTSRASSLRGRAGLVREVHRGVHDRDVRKGLREVAEELLGLRIVLLRHEPHVVGQREQPLES